MRDAVQAHVEKIVTLATASQPVLQLPIVRCLLLRRQHPSCVGNRHLWFLVLRRYLWRPLWHFWHYFWLLHRGLLRRTRRTMTELWWPHSFLFRRQFGIGLPAVDCQIVLPCRLQVHLLQQV